MPVKMKALRTFRGRPGEGNERNRVKSGTEFSVENDSRASALVRGGLAVVVQGAAKSEGKDGKPKKENKAAEAGPTKAQAGGKTGEGNAQSLSDPAPAQKKGRGGPTKKDKTEPASS